jgi:hypothetical protein
MCDMACRGRVGRRAPSQDCLRAGRRQLRSEQGAELVVALSPAHHVAAVLAGHPVVLAGHPVSSVDQTSRQNDEGRGTKDGERGLVKKVFHIRYFPMSYVHHASRITQLVTVWQTPKQNLILCHVTYDAPVTITHTIAFRNLRNSRSFL